MHRRLRRAAALAGLAGGLLLMTACGLGSDPTAAARVNGETITRAELQREVSRMAESAGPQASVPAGASPALRASMLERLIALRLMRQQAKADGIAVSEREIDERIARIQGETGGRDQFLRLLQDEDFTGLSFRQAVQDLILSERLGEKHVPATATVEQRHVRHVLVDFGRQGDRRAPAARRRRGLGEGGGRGVDRSGQPGPRRRSGLHPAGADRAALRSGRLLAAGQRAEPAGPERVRLPHRAGDRGALGAAHAAAGGGVAAARLRPVPPGTAADGARPVPRRSAGPGAAAAVAPPPGAKP